MNKSNREMVGKVPINIKSEVGRLIKVILHRPGGELEHLVPKEMERLLFDDIPYLKTAQQEHDFFASILKEQGVEVVYLEDLMAETLKYNPQIRESFIRQFISEGGIYANKFENQLYDFLNSIENEKSLVLKTMEGVSKYELHGVHNPLADVVKPGNSFILDPIPNLYFTRDPFSSIGNGVSINYMYSATRRRETIFGKYIIEHHPEFASNISLYYKREYPFSIEGGDILNLSSRVLLVGISQRTKPEAIELLAQNIFNDINSKIESIVALYIPKIRAYMHLDTVLTQIDYDKFTVHPGILEDIRAFDICKGDKKGSIQVTELYESLPIILGTHMGIDKITLLPCGGKDQVTSEREQWNDGSNVLCVAPGRIIVYDRNHITNGILRDNGVEVLEMPSSELSRGRGGPRCMSMPLIRE